MPLLGRAYPGVDTREGSTGREGEVPDLLGVHPDSSLTLIKLYPVEFSFWSTMMDIADVGGRGNFSRRASVGVTGVLWLSALNVTHQEGIHLVSAGGNGKSELPLQAGSWVKAR